MIVFTRLSGGAIAINPDMIERVEQTPDTVITLIDDKKFLVVEDLQQVIDLIIDYRAYVIARSNDLELVDIPRPTLHLVPTATLVAPPDTDLEGIEIATTGSEGDDPNIVEYLDSSYQDSEIN